MFSMPNRIVLDRKQLAVVITVWLRALPKWAWGKDPVYEKARKTWRHKPDEEPDPKRMAGELIAAKIAELDWEVSYEERGNPFADRVGAEAKPNDRKADAST